MRRVPVRSTPTPAYPDLVRSPWMLGILAAGGLTLGAATLSGCQCLPTGEQEQVQEPVPLGGVAPRIDPQPPEDTGHKGEPETIPETIPEVSLEQVAHPRTTGTSRSPVPPVAPVRPLNEKRRTLGEPPAPAPLPPFFPPPEEQLEGDVAAPTPPEPADP